MTIINRAESGEDVGFSLEPTFSKVVLRDAAWAAASDGYHTDAVRLFERAMSLGLGDRVVGSFDNVGLWKELFGSALAQAKAGEISAAKRLASTGTFENEESTDYGCRYSNKGSDCYIGAFDNMRESQNPWRRIYPAATNAAILQVEGRWAEAEPLIRNNLEIYRREIGDEEALV